MILTWDYDSCQQLSYKIIIFLGRRVFKPNQNPLIQWLRFVEKKRLMWSTTGQCYGAAFVNYLQK